MRKIFLLAIVFLVFIFAVNAQEIGIRAGNSFGNNFSLDATFGNNVLLSHVDLSFGDAIGFEYYGDFIHEPLSGDYFSIYAGLGLGIVLNQDDLRTNFGGEVGLKYEFENIPISISGDWRPGFSMTSNETAFVADQFGVNVRYVFR